MTNRSLLELDTVRFCAGHFTIFSGEKREKMHGHNYRVSVTFSLELSSEGLNFDYRFYRDSVSKLAKKLNGAFLLAAYSPHTRIEEKEENYVVFFHKEQLFFPKNDVIVMPIRNTTVEELSDWFLENLTEDKVLLQSHGINEMVVKVSSSPGRAGLACYSRL